MIGSIGMLSCWLDRCAQVVGCSEGLTKVSPKPPCEVRQTLLWIGARGSRLRLDSFPRAKTQRRQESEAVPMSAAF